MTNIPSSPINEIGALLRKLDPQGAAAAKERYPEIGRDVEGFWAGEEEKASSTVEHANAAVVLERAKFTLEVLDVAIQKCDQAVERAKPRIARSKWITFAGQITTLIGTSTIIGCLSFGEPEAALITGTLTLIASIASTLSSFILTTNGGEEGRDIIDIYRSLIEDGFDLRTSKIELDSLVRHSELFGVIDAKIGEINGLCRRIYKNSSVVA